MRRVLAASFLLAAAAAAAQDGAPAGPAASCDPAAEGWCDLADGPGANSVIHLDSRFEETPGLWTMGGTWHENAYASCSPGATTLAGVSAYAGDPGCTYPAARLSSLLGPSIGPLGAGTWLTFSTRAGIGAGDAAEVLVNGTPVASIDPARFDPRYWYGVQPISLAAFAGQVARLEFRFGAGASPSGHGWMVDDVLVYDENGADWRCVANARYHAGNPAYASCADAALDRWSFAESGFCRGCRYTFYALVECGTAMHLPLFDMEGAEVTVSEAVSGAPVSLTCSNDAFRDPAAAPVVVSRDCCPAPGVEEWKAPAWSASDNIGPGSVAWGFPACPDLAAAYDLDRDGLECAELDPPCGGALLRLSPGERQGMDCRIAGNPGLCGVYRIDVKGGGAVWDLVANCTGDRSPRFRLFSSCADALAAFTPRPELAIAALRRSASCPQAALEYTLANLGCGDVSQDFRVRLTSDCPLPDLDEWTVTGGLPANTTRAFSRPIAPSCDPARFTLTVDALDQVAECSESGSAAACDAIQGADQASLKVCTCEGGDPPSPFASRACEGRASVLDCGPLDPGDMCDWDFDLDGTYDTSGASVSHVFPGPGSYPVRVRRATLGGCVGLATLTADVDADRRPASAVLLHAVKSGAAGVTFSWTPVGDAVTYRVARGTIGGFYDHTVDDPGGAGRCDTLGLTRLDDPDERALPGSFYYLVAPVSNCGTAGPWGQPGDPTPGAVPSASCP